MAELFGKYLCENLQKSLEKIAKNSQFNLFSTKLKNPALIFWAFGRKIQIVGKFWEIFEFLVRLLLIIERPYRAAFFTISFQFRGEERSLCFPRWRRPMAEKRKPNKGLVQSSCTVVRLTSHK